MKLSRRNFIQALGGGVVALFARVFGAPVADVPEAAGVPNSDSLFECTPDGPPTSMSNLSTSSLSKEAFENAIWTMEEQRVKHVIHGTIGTAEFSFDGDMWHPLPGVSSIETRKGKVVYLDYFRKGDDVGDGKTPETAFRTQARAIQALEGRDDEMIYMVGGG